MLAPFLASISLIILSLFSFLLLSMSWMSEYFWVMLRRSLRGSTGLSKFTSTSARSRLLDRDFTRLKAQTRRDFRFCCWTLLWSRGFWGCFY